MTRATRVRIMKPLRVVGLATLILSLARCGDAEVTQPTTTSTTTTPAQSADGTLTTTAVDLSGLDAKPKEWLTGEVNDTGAVVTVTYDGGVTDCWPVDLEIARRSDNELVVTLREGFRNDRACVARENRYRVSKEVAPPVQKGAKVLDGSKVAK